VFQITTPGDPLFVKGIDNNDYYAVPFNFNVPVIGDFVLKKKGIIEIPPTTSKRIERAGLSETVKTMNEASLPVVEPTLIVILIDAEDGYFKEASWTQTPVKYLPITKQEARNMLPEVLEELGLEAPALSKFQPELIHRESSPYYPEWQFIVDEYAIYIGQDGSVLIEGPADDTRGDGGIMSDGETCVYSLATAVPTPFTKSTMISYSIAIPGHVSLKVYDISGRLVRILVNEKKNAGVYHVVWNGNDENNDEVAPGIYFTECISREFTSVKKVILVK
jgi:hypothetical protein